MSFLNQILREAENDAIHGFISSHNSFFENLPLSFFLSSIFFISSLFHKRAHTQTHTESKTGSCESKGYESWVMIEKPRQTTRAQGESRGIDPDALRLQMNVSQTERL